MKFRCHHLLFAAAALQISCTVHPVRDEVGLPAFTPERFSESGVTTRDDRWWETYGDENLDQLVETALHENYDIKTAWARLAQFNALAKLAGAELYPQVNFNTTIGRNENEINNRTVSSNQFSLNLGASYEIDLWKRIESQQNAAAQDLLAGQEDIEATALAIASLVTQQWFFIVEQNAQFALLNEQLKVSETFLELNELRFGQGLATAVDVYQQREQVASIQSQFPQIESNLVVLRHQLAFLLGKPPKYDLPAVVDVFPAIAGLPDTGLPADTLLQRPDVRAAQRRVAAADYRVASAIADRFPALRLTGQTGLQAGQFNDLFSNTFWNIASGLLTPVIDGQRRQAEIERSQAILKERVYAYESTVLIALMEIENALIQERKQSERIVMLENQLDIARKTLSESQSRFLSGLSDYLPVLTALTETQRLERLLLSEKRELYLFRLDLYEAMGGSWMKTVPSPDDFNTENNQTVQND